MRDKITVIIPVKNGEQFLSNCIESFFKQNIPDVDKELILVDDGSTDNSYNMLKKHEGVGVVVLRNNGTGIIDALSTGLNKATGNYISRMDIDDIMPEDKLLRLYQVLKTKHVNVATGKVKYFHYQKKEIGEGYLKYQNWLNGLVENQNFYKDIYKECVVASPNWMMSKSDLKNVGGFEGDYPEDYNLVFKWYNAGYKVHGIDEVTHHWYDHSSRASRNDVNYKENSFFELKLKWFLSVDFDSSRKILVYGAGNKGKVLAKKLIDRGHEIRWCSNNPKKVGKNIYGVILISDRDSIQEMNCQIIVAIAVESEKKVIRQRLEEYRLREGMDFFFFS